MKKILTAVICAVLLTGCSGGESSVSVTPDSTPLLTSDPEPSAATDKAEANEQNDSEGETVGVKEPQLLYNGKLMNFLISTHHTILEKTEDGYVFVDNGTGFDIQFYNDVLCDERYIGETIPVAGTPENELEIGYSQSSASASLYDAGGGHVMMLCRLTADGADGGGIMLGHAPDMVYGGSFLVPSEYNYDEAVTEYPELHHKYSDIISADGEDDVMRLSCFGVMYTCSEPHYVFVGKKEGDSFRLEDTCTALSEEDISGFLSKDEFIGTSVPVASGIPENDLCMSGTDIPAEVYRVNNDVLLCLFNTSGAEQYSGLFFTSADYFNAYLHHYDILGHCFQ